MPRSLLLLLVVALAAGRAAAELEVELVEPLPLLGSRGVSLLETGALASAAVGCPSAGAPCCADAAACPAAYQGAMCCGGGAAPVCCPGGTSCMPAGQAPGAKAACARQPGPTQGFAPKIAPGDARVTEGRAVSAHVASDEVPVVVTDGAGRVQRLYTPPPPAASNPDGRKYFEREAPDGVVETAFAVSARFQIDNYLYTHYTVSAKNAEATRRALRKDVALAVAMPVKFVRANSVRGARFKTAGTAREERIPPTVRQRRLAAYRRRYGGPQQALLEEAAAAAAGAGAAVDVQFDQISGAEANVTVYAKTPRWAAKVARTLYNRLERASLALPALQGLPLDARGNNARLFKVRGAWGVRFDNETITHPDQIEKVMKRLELEFIHTVKKDPRHLWKDMSPGKWRLDGGDIKSLSVVTAPVLKPFEQSFQIDSLHHQGVTVSRLLPDGFDGYKFRFVIAFYDDSIGDMRNDWVGVGMESQGGRGPIYHDYVIGLYGSPFHYSYYPAWTKTKVRRTVGWHRFEFIGNEKEVHYFIDGQHVHSRKAQGKVVGFTVRGNGGTVATWSPWELYKPVPIKNW